VQEEAAALSVVDQLGQLGGGMSVSLGRFLQAVYDYGLLGVASWLFSSPGLLTTIILLAALIAIVLTWVLLRRARRRAGGPRRSRTPRDPSLIALHKMLARMDRKLGAVGPKRHLTETLHAFARRLRTHDADDAVWVSVSDWYYEYAELRYRREVSTEHLALLQHRADRLRRAL
jgi:hypothetical protein